MKRFFIPSVFAVLLASPAFAINWEGHDEWLDDAPLAEEFTDGVPPPLPKAMPSCDERARRARANSHEQVPLPGVNCRPLKKDKPVDGGG